MEQIQKQELKKLCQVLFCTKQIQMGMTLDSKKIYELNGYLSNLDFDSSLDGINNTGTEGREMIDFDAFKHQFLQSSLKFDYNASQYVSKDTFMVRIVCYFVFCLFCARIMQKNQNQITSLKM